MNSAFMSDNTAPVDERVLKAISDANEGFAKSYGYDDYTIRAEELIRKEFGADALFFPVLTGTGANVISLSSMLSPFQSVICAETAHINVDECGAPERFLGSKLVTVRTEQGKLTPANIKPLLNGLGFEHHSQPRVISISQVTETGVAYTIDEVKALSDFAKANNLLLHIDGSRLANAAEYLGCSMGWAVKGADVVSFGGTKNGLMIGEAAIFLNPSLAENCKYIRKQAMQLFSKMRYISAQYIPYLEDKLWWKNASHANAMAKKLAVGFENAGFKLEYPINSNVVFVYFPEKLINMLSEKFGFYVWDEENNLCRFMCSFATLEEDVDSLIREIS